jgi:DNA-binding transcriptional regulator GbsR (MarR family)
MGGKKMKQINAVIIPTEFIDEYLKTLTLPEVKVFIILCRLTTGYAANIREYISLEELCDKSGLSIDAVKPALKNLEIREIIKVEHRRGRGKTNGYTINYTNKTGVLNPPFKNPCLKPPLHDFEKPINIIERAVDDPVPASPVPSASKKRRASSIPKQKKSNEERDAFKAVYAVFEKKRGAFEPGVKSREMKAIWELIDKAKAVESIGWVDLLVKMTSEFCRIKESDRKEDKFLANRPFLPSSLNSPGIWPRVLDNLRETEGRKPTAEDVRLMDLGIAAIRG